LKLPQGDSGNAKTGPYTFSDVRPALPDSAGMDKQIRDAEWAADALAAMLARIAKALAVEYEAAALRLRKWAA
jgi:hypothetical protein